MKKKDFIRRVVGRLIVSVHLRDKDCFEIPSDEEDLLIDYIELEGGARIYLRGAGEIDRSDVWAELRGGDRGIEE